MQVKIFKNKRYLFMQYLSDENLNGIIRFNYKSENTGFVIISQTQFKKLKNLEEISEKNFIEYHLKTFESFLDKMLEQIYSIKHIKEKLQNLVHFGDIYPKFDFEIGKLEEPIKLDDSLD